MVMVTLMHRNDDEQDRYQIFVYGIARIHGPYLFCKTLNLRDWTQSDVRLKIDEDDGIILSTMKLIWNIYVSSKKNINWIGNQ